MEQHINKLWHRDNHVHSLHLNPWVHSSEMLKNDLVFSRGCRNAVEQKQKADKVQVSLRLTRL